MVQLGWHSLLSRQNKKDKKVIKIQAKLKCTTHVLLADTAFLLILGEHLLEIFGGGRMLDFHVFPEAVPGVDDGVADGAGEARRLDMLSLDVGLEVAFAA